MDAYAQIRTNVHSFKFQLRRMHSLVTYPRALVKGVDGTLRSRSRLLFSADAGEGRGGACGGEGEGSGGAATGSGLAAATAAGSAATAAAVPAPAITCVRAGCAGSCAGGRSNGGSCGAAAASSWVKYTTEEDEEDSAAGRGPAPGGACGRRGVPLVRPARSVAARSADLRTSRGEVPLVASRATSAAPSSRRRRSLDAMGRAEGREAGDRRRGRSLDQEESADAWRRRARRDTGHGSAWCWAPREYHFMGFRLRG